MCPTYTTDTGRAAEHENVNVYSSASVLFCILTDLDIYL